jgi:formylglycine-generating enzyme required for sulfatase activity
MNAGVCTVAPWGTIFGCVGHGMLQHGLRALAGLAPGGSVIYEVCAAAAGEWKKSVDRAEERQVIEQMLAKSRDEIKAEVAQQIAELKKHATPEQAQQMADPKVAQGLELYLETIPDHMRANLRRPEDPSGNSVPVNFSLREEHGFAAILPNRTPRFRTGDKVGNYVLTEPLGLGGFGEVWKARHIRLSSRVAAIKFCLDEASQRNLRHESSLIDRVQLLQRQPGIVELWDAFLDHNPPCLVYQFIEGGDLTGLMRTLKTLPAKERETRAVEVMIALASIVAPLHAMVPPIIHRDLKPANILISRNNGQDSFWITDFGIGALAADSALAGHRHGMSRGDLMSQSLRGTHTPMYASPEQVNHAVPDPRDDVHALAVIAYQLLVGESAEKPGTDLEDVLKDLGINVSLIQILKDALRTKREQRLEHAGIFADRLLQLISPPANKQQANKTSAEKVNDARQPAKLEEERRATPKAKAAWQEVNLEDERREAAKAEAARQSEKLEDDRRETAMAEAARQAGKLEDERREAAKAEAARQSAKLEEERSEVLKVFEVKTPSKKRAENYFAPIWFIIIASAAILIFFIALTPKLPPSVLKTQSVNLGKGVGLEMALIPAGKFQMGSPDSEVSRISDELQHEVTISRDFYIGRTEVTQAQWVSVMGKNPSFFKGDQLPVERVNWNDAVEFCNRLSEMPEEKKAGRKYRLPTESEWEYACRAGTTTPFHFGSHLNGTQANCDGTFPYGTIWKGPNLKITSPVGKYPANAWGLHDMHGNVWEWCSDYGPTDYPVGSVTDPSGPSTGSSRVLRGGCWEDVAMYCRSANRIRGEPSNSSENRGFRLALSPSGIAK